ncbi:unnamed protein product [[Candida] boidinii]|nr:unnamed protein product [[Candida] boidinii]
MSQPSTNGLNADINHFGIISGSSAATGVTDINYHSNSFENDGLNAGFTPSISTSSTEYDEQDQSYEGGFDPTIGPTDSSDGNNNNNNNNNENINTNNNLIDGVAVWQPDEDVTNCCICHSSFTFFHRKHHCRKCGRIVCGDCSSVFTNYLPSTYVVCPPSQVFLESPHVPHRTCDDCVDELDMIRRALRRNNASNVLNSPGNSNNISGGSNRFSDNASTVLPPEIAKNVKDITHRTTTLLLDDESRTNSSSRSSIRDFNRQIGVMSPILTQRNNSTSNKNNGSSNANINTTNSGSSNSNNNSNGISTSDQDTDMDLCPICAKNLKSLSEEKKEKHIDDCLTSAEFSGSPDTKRHFNRMLVYNIPLPLSEKGKIKSILKKKTNANSSNNNTPISSLNPKEPIPDYMISRVLDIPNGSNRDGSISSSSENNNLKAVNGVNSGSISTVRSNNTNKSSCIDGSSLNKIVGGSSLDTINNNSGQITTGFSDEAHSDYNIDEIISPPSGDNNHTSSSKYNSDHEDEEGKDEDEDEDDDDYPECVICFEPLKPGDKVGRLECLCVFHYKCIKGWFERKGASECPVHAIHMN